VNLVGKTHTSSNGKTPKKGYKRSWKQNRVKKIETIMRFFMEQIKGKMSESSYDAEAHEREMDTIHEMFPTAPFSVCIPLREFDNVLSTEEHIVIKCCHTCYCYDHNPRGNEYIVIKANGHNITVKDAIKALVDSGYDPACNHAFLEGFDKENGIQFEAAFGS
jgi:hypothetical protein